MREAERKRGKANTSLGMSLKKNWRVLINDSAHKYLSRIPRKDLEKVSEAIDQISNNPFKGDIVKFVGQLNAWRRRVGNYRILFEANLEKKLIYIYEIKRRTSNTY